MNSLDVEEFTALRSTIRARGTARVWVFLVGLALWAGVLLSTTATMALPVATLLPLLMLAAVYEAVYSLHIGVERIGRYLQVFYEAGPGRPAGLGWEHAAMAFGREAPAGGGVDPLFSTFFWLAAVANLIPSVLAGAVAVEWTVIGLLHLTFAARVALGRRYAMRQRARELEIFQRIKAATLNAPAQS